MEWQPIETAPKDGSHILIAWRGRALIAFWRNEQRIAHGRTVSDIQKWCITDSRLLTFQDDPNPTHWMPLPEPPK